MITKIPYKDREEWLEIRSHYVGGSDAASIVGLNPYESPYSLWAKKTGRVPEFGGNIATKVGTYMEEFVAHLFEEETGKKVRKCNYTLHNDEYPFAAANVDRLIVGEDAGLEIKTTSALNLRKFKGGEFPTQYYCQMIHYMAVTGRKKWYLAVLIGNRDFRVFELERDQAEIDALMDAERRFWYEHVETDVPPPPDGSDAATDALRTIYAESRDEERELFGRGNLLDEYMALKRQEKAIKERQAEIENALKEDLQEAERGRCGSYFVSWKSQSRSTFQVKDFAKAHPEIDLAPYYKSTTSRPFKITAEGIE